MSEPRLPIRAGLEEVARSAATQLEQAAARDAVRRGAGRALVLLTLVPIVALAGQLVRLAAGADAGWFSWWLVPIALVPAAVYAVVRFATNRRRVTHREALAALDQRLRTGDRLRTADEFLARPARTGFMQAAIEDAAPSIEAARTADVRPAAAPLTTRMLERVAVPAAFTLLALAFWLSVIQPGRTMAPVLAAETALTTGAAEVTPTAEDIVPPPTPVVVPDPPATPQREKRDEKARARDAAPVSRTIPDGTEEAHGSLGVGETSESDQSSNPSNARGAPSSQGQPSKPGETPKKKAGRTGQRPPDRAQKEQPPRETSDPAGSTAGQGSSKGSNQNPAVSDWSSRDQVETPDDDQLDEEQDVDDEDEEQESRGGLQPNLRDRRPPVNRDLRIGFGNRSSPDANGRGGPGQQKKSRGVASFVLGVPIPDRVKGQPNPGKTKVTQQRIEPEAEQATTAEAQPRAPRDGAVGPVYHPVLTPAMRQLVRDYFLQQRRAAVEAAAATSSEENEASP